MCHILEKADHRAKEVIWDFQPNFIESMWLGKIEMYRSLIRSAWLSQQSSWNWNLSVIRLSSVRPSSVTPLNLRHGFLSNFGCCFPWVIRRGNFFNFFLFFIFLFFFDILWIFFWLTCDPMGAKISKRYSYKIAAESFHTFSEFSS